MARPDPLFPNRKGDWEYAQVQYETTTKSCDEIGLEIGMTATTVIAKASSKGWTRNRKSAIVAHTAELALATLESRKKQREEKLEVIERVNIEMQAAVLKTHRKDIAAARRISNTLMDRLKLEIEDRSEEAMTLDMASGIMKRMTDSLKTLILLERQAFGIQSAIEELETTAESRTPEGTALDMLMHKFASALQKNSLNSSTQNSTNSEPTMVFEASDGSPTARS